MIEQYKSSWEYDCSSTPEAWTHNCYMLVNFVEGLKLKINELVDAVNKHEDIIRQIGEWGSSKGECLWCDTLTEFNPGKPQKEPDDPFAEQKKWIGKLCWFSNGDGFDEDVDEVGYLTEIDPDMPEAKFRCDCHDYYKDCKPVKPDDDIIYKGE